MKKPQPPSKPQCPKPVRIRRDLSSIFGRRRSEDDLFRTAASRVNDEPVTPHLHDHPVGGLLAEICAAKYECESSICHL